jgi:hypothetical protein
MYSYSPVFNVNGKVTVSIDGVLDGADVITKVCRGIGEDAQIIAPCSWLSSKGIEFSGAESGYELIPNNYIFFQIVNAGANTNVTLKFSVIPFQNIESKMVNAVVNDEIIVDEEIIGEIDNG